MDIFTFIFLVVLVGCSIPLLKLWLEGRRTVATAGEGTADSVSATGREASTRSGSATSTP